MLEHDGFPLLKEKFEWLADLSGEDGQAFHTFLQNPAEKLAFQAAFLVPPNMDGGVWGGPLSPDLVLNC